MAALSPVSPALVVRASARPARAAAPAASPAPSAAGRSRQTAALSARRHVAVAATKKAADTEPEAAALNPFVGEQFTCVWDHQPWIDRPRSEEAVANTCGADVQARPDPSGEDAGERGRFDKPQHARLILRRSAKDTHSVYQNDS